MGGIVLIVLFYRNPISKWLGWIVKKVNRMVLTYDDVIEGLLKDYFSTIDENDFSVRRGLNLDKGIYSPRLDIA
ncbi:hypothetical protein HQ584_01075, partial [Patescibacteria group bacterium]|nr:hypothetical protein [Patescibacteria group bacterium]